MYFNVLALGSNRTCFRFNTSRKGHPKIIGGGYGFILDKNGDGNTTYWMCDRRRQTKCTGRLLVKNKEISVRGQHSHPPEKSKFWFCHNVYIGTYFFLSMYLLQVSSKPMHAKKLSVLFHNYIYIILILFNLKSSQILFFRGYLGILLPG